VWDLRNKPPPTPEQCKQLLHFAITELRNSKRYIKVSVQNGPAITPRQVIDALMSRTNDQYALLWHQRHMTAEDQQFALYIQNLHHLDLHGFPVKVARSCTESTLAAAQRFDQDRVRVVTGRGNHVNPNGQRGVLAAALPEWTKQHKTTKDTAGGMYNVQLERAHRVTIPASHTLEEVITVITRSLLEHPRIRLDATTSERIDNPRFLIQLVSALGLSIEMGDEMVLSVDKH
jgi:hypothetical protein